MRWNFRSTANLRPELRDPVKELGSRPALVMFLYSNKQHSYCFADFSNWSPSVVQPTFFFKKYIIIIVKNSDNRIRMSSVGLLWMKKIKNKC